MHLYLYSYFCQIKLSELKKFHSTFVIIYVVFYVYIGKDLQITYNCFHRNNKSVSSSKNIKFWKVSRFILSINIYVHDKAKNILQLTRA